MLAEDTKEQIRAAYGRLMDEKGLSPRWGQRQMIAEIANTLARIESPEPEQTPHCVIEAGTGTGKTIAYAVAAIPVAQKLEKTLVISTATIALQEQLVLKDLPDIRQHSGLEFDFVLAKGRRRYVCLSRLDKLLMAGGQDDMVIPLYPDEVDQTPAAEALPVYNSMIDALGRGEWDGDRDAWTQELSEDIWFSVTTDHSQCSGRRCPNIGQCSFFRARDALQNADVIVTNHDLVLSDLALGGGAILSAPEDSIYIFDEGHHLPAKALNHFSGFCRLGSTLQWLEDCQAQLAQAASQLVAAADLAEPILRLQPQFENIVAVLALVQDLLPELEDMPLPRESGERAHLRFGNGEIPPELQEYAQQLALLFDQLQGQLQRIEARLEDALDGDITGIDASDAEAWFTVFGAMLNRAEGNLALWSDYADAPLVAADSAQPGKRGSQAHGPPPTARWINVFIAGGQLNYELRCSPILASEILQQHLWDQAAAVVATSATMTALSSFERFILHSGVPRTGAFKVVPSPFDHDRAILSVPAMDCDPGNPEAHTQALIEKLPQWLRAGEGSLVLFSSRRQLSEVYQGLPDDWRALVLLQGDHSKHEILQRHRAAVDAGAGSVIFGLASFAEGVDLPGSYCQHVLIAKIPFAVPDNPLDAALSEWVESQGRNAFMDITVPDAALRLVQACGRLLRTEEDSGRVTICDRRLVTRRYGRALLDSLPPFRRELA
ncbi:MAG: ATP-dependent DNA helicase DinG [Halieaceae bacterium]